MNVELEKTFIKNFINKINQDRLAFELSSKGNRIAGIEKFAHNAEKILRAEKIVFRGKNLTAAEAERNLLSFGCRVNEKVYFISTGKEDGQTLSLGRAVQLCMENYSPTIILCNENLAFIKMETENGAALKLILQNKKQA